MDQLSINGDWPNIEGKVVESLIVQEFWCEGKLQDQANVLYLKVSGNWHRLFFDYSIIFWREGDNGLNDESADRGKEFGYPLIDYGKELSLVGTHVVSCIGKKLAEGAQVKLAFSSGQSLTVQCIDDETKIET